MRNNSFFKRVLFICSVILLCSCDKDYNSIGDDLIGGNHFTFEKYSGTAIVYNQKISAIQSNNQTVNPLGIYEDPDFGTTTANFVTQLTLASVNPVVINPTNVIVESVVLSIPYFVDATQTVINTDGSHTYVLDSIYGGSVNGAKIKLSVFRSGYYLRSLDPTGGFVNAQNYYTDQNTIFNNVKIGNRLNNDSSTSQNDEFFFDNSEEATTTTVDGVTTTTYAPPAMRLNLNKVDFKTDIINAVASGKLISNDVFKDYYRGLYFQVEKSGAYPTNLAMMNFAGGTITIKYKDETSATDATLVDRSIVLNLIGNTVSLLEQTDTKTGYANATSSANSTTGDSKLYVKGGEGSIAILDILGNGELESLKNKGWLINEANLIFHVDKTTFTGIYEPQRLYLYDLNNNRPIVDYYDSSTGTTAKNGKTVYGGLLTKDASGNSYYKFRITNHVRNLIQKDSINIKLGLVVTEAITNSTSVKLKPGSLITNITEAPQASVMNPLGTILFGNNIPESDPNYDKRLKLEIYYTKPN
ncbi:DUF4270 domain-containing protein [Flavobacterium sp.]|uniref:DUF4270 domain-containing protein n=1 Tax=Flavobacterium sp. TaxID=239 RepID=UPI003C5D87AE